MIEFTPSAFGAGRELDHSLPPAKTVGRAYGAPGVLLISLREG